MLWVQICGCGLWLFTAVVTHRGLSWWPLVLLRVNCAFLQIRASTEARHAHWNVLSCRGPIIAPGRYVICPMRFLTYAMFFGR